MRQPPYDLVDNIQHRQRCQCDNRGHRFMAWSTYRETNGNLEQAARALAEDNQALPLPLERSDELGALARSFDDMRQRLAQQFNELRLATQATEAAASLKTVS